MKEERGLRAVQVAALLVSASYGIGFLFGSGEMAVAHGMAGSIYGLATAAGMLVLALLSARLWASGTPIWDIFGKVYGPQFLRIVALLSIIWMSGVLAAQIQGGVAVLQLLGASTPIAFACVLALIFTASRMNLGMASALFSACLLASGLVLLYALHATGGLATYAHAPQHFISDISTFKPSTAAAIAIAVAVLVCTGADYHQFVLAARRPGAAAVGCVLAAVALAMLSFLPPALIVTMVRAGSLSEVSDARQVVPRALAHVAATFGHGADKVLLAALSAAALGSGAAILRAMVDALRSCVGHFGRRANRAYEIGMLAAGAIMAHWGHGIVHTMVAVNALYISAIGLVFIGLLLRRPPPPRAATAMLASGFSVALLVQAAKWLGWLAGDIEMLSMALALTISAVLGSIAMAIERIRPSGPVAEPLSGPPTADALLAPRVP